MQKNDNNKVVESYSLIKQENHHQLHPTEDISSKKRERVSSDSTIDGWRFHQDEPPWRQSEAIYNFHFPLSLPLCKAHLQNVQSEQMWCYCSGRPFRLIFIGRGDRQIGRRDVLFFCGSNIALGNVPSLTKGRLTRRWSNSSSSSSRMRRMQRSNKERLRPTFTAEGWWIKAPY